MKTAKKSNEQVQEADTAQDSHHSPGEEAVKGDSRVTQDGDTVTRISTSRGELVILGTAHVSEDSAREVDQTIRDEQPEAVCIELDQNRFKSLNQENSWKNLDIFQIIKQKKTFLLLSNLVLSAYQKRLGLNLGTKPGDEMRAAVAAADELGITKFMIDRDIQMTLSRAWRKTGFWGKNKILAVLIGSAFSREKLDEEAIESLKQRSALDDMMKEMAEFLPSVKQVLIDERDHYLAINSWKKMAGREKVLSIVGAGHVPGMVRKILELDDQETPHNNSSEEHAESELKQISRVPPRGIISKSLPWLLVAAIAGLIISGFITKGWEGGLQSLLRWILVNGTLSALGAAVALGHPVTVISSFLAAPVTSMNPTIGVGFVTGMLEALLRKPRVQDFEKLGDDITTIRGFFRNRITRILLVFFFSSLGSSIGTFIALPLLFP